MEKSPTCIFENEKVSFKSYIFEFTPELYEEFDLKADNLGLQSKLDDLFSGKKVNYTEGLAAWHPKYRAEYDPISFDTPSNKKQHMMLSNLNDLCKAAKNIVTIGIGGSFEGPKMFLETLELLNSDSNFIFIKKFPHYKIITLRLKKLNSQMTKF